MWVSCVLGSWEYKMLFQSSTFSSTKHRCLNFSKTASDKFPYPNLFLIPRFRSFLLICLFYSERLIILVSWGLMMWVGSRLRFVFIITRKGHLGAYCIVSWPWPRTSFPPLGSSQSLSQWCRNRTILDQSWTNPGPILGPSPSPWRRQISPAGTWIALCPGWGQAEQGLPARVHPTGFGFWEQDLPWSPVLTSYGAVPSPQEPGSWGTPALTVPWYMTSDFSFYPIIFWQGRTNL